MTVTIAREDAIAIVTVDNPPVNALSQALRQALVDTVAELDADARVKAVVLLCAGRTFIAGADVSEFGKPPLPPHLPDVVASIENAKSPGSRRFTVARLAAVSKWLSAVPIGWRFPTPVSVCRRSSLASFPALVGRCACRA